MIGLQGYKCHDPGFPSSSLHCCEIINVIRFITGFNVVADWSISSGATPNKAVIAEGSMDNYRTSEKVLNIDCEQKYAGVCVCVCSMGWSVGSISLRAASGP